MASTKADQNRVAWTYTDNKGEDWRVSAKAVYVLDGTDGAKYGGSAAATSVPRLPKGYRMRKVYAKCGGKIISFPAYDITADVWTTPGTTVTRNLNGVDTSAETTQGTLEEHRPGAGITQSS